jgi:hypothetical protein
MTTEAVAMVQSTKVLCRSCGSVVAAGFFLMAALTGPVLAAEHGGGGGGEGGAPPPVNTNTNPDALILNTKNPYAIHAGPGKPNVGSVYLPPTVSGKDKKGKSGQTEQQVMGGAPTH